MILYKTNDIRYFAFSTLKNSDKMKEVLGYKPRNMAHTLDGYELYKDKNGYARIKQNKNQSVVGRKYFIKKSDIKKLDNWTGLKAKNVGLNTITHL